MPRLDATALREQLSLAVADDAPADIPAPRPSTPAAVAFRQGAQAAAAAAPAAKMMTANQQSLIRTMLDERKGNEQAEAIRVGLNHQRENGGITFAAASAAIDALRPIMRNTQTREQASKPEVADGKYALRADDEVKFYEVNTPTSGKWEGFTFVNVLAGPESHPVRGKAGTEVLRKIAADPGAASALYGQEIGVCGVCGIRLTKEESRERGIGPVCAKNMGWDA